MAKKHRSKYCEFCGSSLEHYYSVRTAAKLTNLSPEFFRKRIREKTITHVKIGGSVRIPASAIDRLITIIPSTSDEVESILSNNI